MWSIAHCGQRNNVDLAGSHDVSNQGVKENHHPRYVTHYLQVEMMWLRLENFGVVHMTLASGQNFGFASIYVMTNLRVMRSLGDCE
jgi:hypothetical protein